jgi:hypothetical protein
MNTNIKYTPDQEDELKDGYNAINFLAISDTQKHDEREIYILKYMAKHSKSKRSVIAKLSKMGIYIARPKISKVTGDKPETKEKMVSDIAIALGMNPEELEGLDKTPKLVLMKLRERIS